MQIPELIKILKKHFNKLLDKEGWSVAFELQDKGNKGIDLKIKNQFLQLAKNQYNLNKTTFEIPSFKEILDHKRDIEVKLKDEGGEGIEPYTVYTYKVRLLRDLNKIFTENEKLNEINNFAQENNYSYINSVHIKNFFSIGNINFTEIKGTKEIYLLGENGDGKSLVLMALHLAFNGRWIDKKTNFEFTGKIKEIIKTNSLAHFNASDTDGLKYGGEKIAYLKNFLAYGVHRGRYSSDKFNPYGYTSLYDSELQLFSPERLLNQTFLLELERQVDKEKTNSQQKEPSKWIPLEEIQNLFQTLLESNVQIKVGSEGVKFIEKGFSLAFNQLSEGYKNIMVWVSDMIYRFQQNQPETNKLEDFKGIVLLDEIELHLHPIWQRRIIRELRKFFPNIQFVLTTHSPTIIQGASEDAIIYRIYRNPNTGKTSSSEAYFKKDLDHLMLNSLATSPLFGLEDARVSRKVEDVDTSDTYIESRIRERVNQELKNQKEAGKEFLSEYEIDNLIDKILKEESKRND